MKKKIGRILILAMLAASLLFVLGGCELFESLSEIRSRINDFEDELNSMNRSSVYLNFSPTQTIEYNTIKASSFWDSIFSVNYDYEFTDIVSNDALMIATGILKMKSGGLTVYSPDVAFTFVREGGTVLIKSFACTGYTTVDQIFPGIE